MASPGIATTLDTRYIPTRMERWTYWISRHWILAFSIILGVYVGLPFLAPFLMHLGLNVPARAIYLIYSFLCHQLPERSYFLFGQKFTYTLPEIQSAWQNTLNPAILRQFIGNPTMGWKVAWSDRMVSMFASVWLFGIIWWLLRRKLKPLPWWWLVLFLLPLAIDGTTHLFSDLFGIEQGFPRQQCLARSANWKSLPRWFLYGGRLGIVQFADAPGHRDILRHRRCLVRLPLLR